MREKQKAADVLKRPTLPKLNHGKPIRASELVKRRAAEAVVAFQKAVDKRETAFVALARAHANVWKCARAVKRYEHLVQ